MVSVRTTTIGGISYLQVVRYLKTPDGKTKIDVVKSFGRDTLENRLKAEQFAASYDKLEEFASQFKQQQGRESNELLSVALAIFGVVLGAAIVSAIIANIFSDD
ncbi:hypothetical protein [Nitrososphaera viennensis]|uniref:Uncharacterized protein n=2 Tax=Nitrososphaera viennensis TaxID=1034015 RepID=A0A060HUR2_9ARCH|nr:hypothetical protein [Nitrososphaera viennensis]AIC16817.1 hypothetical protein NVIE_025470 [Nitrososphaera viennensis EN76]UVS68723.1 hypothetical protein NWT39_12555 [Nitrososphaera viennensis]